MFLERKLSIDYYTASAAWQTPFWFIRYTAAGHWLADLLLQSLRPLLTVASEDVLICAVMVLSQVDFASVGFAAFNDAVSIAETKDSFKCSGIIDFISDPVVLERLACLASSRPQCFFSEASENLETEIQNAIEMRLIAANETERIRSTMLYLQKVGEELQKSLVS
ncbi:hypothetical protein OESDEN_05056 [Oesophagostomum dentatum]|uniref:Uncharacterized protein n=1 Tax=Oesophagostomum dentatum TaxID=61180 RepID=A0A0B1THX1_OESDE|nr:hypothetical protein OESDEN_05056 [Oesophagostomum dentatum]